MFLRWKLPLTQRNLVAELECAPSAWTRNGMTEVFIFLAFKKPERLRVFSIPSTTRYGPLVTTGPWPLAWVVNYGAT